MNNETREQLLEKIATSITTQILDGLKETVRCCIHCSFFDGQRELCTNKNNCALEPARPPARIIAFGCDYFEEKAPF